MREPTIERRERPLLFTLVTLTLALGVSVLALWWTGESPETVLIGLPGRHDARASDRLADCLDCHVPFIGTPGSRCLAPGCHGELATGTPPLEGPAMPIRFHVAMRDAPCSQCHIEHEPIRDATPLSFRHGIIPEKTLEECARCHSGRKVANHARTDAMSCAVCHATDRWVGITMSHERVSETPCDLCHVAPDSRAHLSVAGTCTDCHSATTWSEIHD